MDANKLNEYDAMLLGHVRKYGAAGVTAADLCADTGLWPHTVSKQLYTLEARGFVEVIGKRRSRTTKTPGKIRRAV